MSIEPKWRDHHWTKLGVVELVPTEWVHRFYGRDVSPKADLMDGALVELDELWADLQKNGLHEPLLFRVGVRDRQMRLEAGNHRIQVFHDHDVSYVPLAGQVRPTCGPEREDVWTDAQRVYDGTDHIAPGDDTDAGIIRPSRALASLTVVPGPTDVSVAVPIDPDAP